MKMMKPVIGIIPTYNQNETTDPYQDQAKFVRLYSKKIEECGGIPIGLLEEGVDYTKICDGYLWPGGNVILRKFNYVLQDALQNQKPLLGICLGMQSIATFFNVLEDQEITKTTYEETYQDQKQKNPYLRKLPDENIHLNEVTKEQECIEKAKHPIKIKPKSTLYEIYHQDKVETISLHSIVVNRIPKTIDVVATANDGEIEAIEYKKNRTILGVQYHPELENESQIFEWLLWACKKYTALVNKENPLRYRLSYQIESYKSEYPKCILDSNIETKTKKSWLLFKKYLKKHGYEAEIESAYRTKKLQEQIYNEIAIKEGKEYARKYVAKPTQSEHETGTSLDICLKKQDKWLNGFDEELNEFYLFLSSHCAEFGFILRYPKGKEQITGYSYEPWNLRYIDSIELAKYLMEKNLTLEEYQEQK